MTLNEVVDVCGRLSQARTETMPPALSLFLSFCLSVCLTSLQKDIKAASRLGRWLRYFPYFP